MSFKIVLLPPGIQDHWPAAIRSAVPGVRVSVCDDPALAGDEIADADAAYGTIPPDLLSRAARLQWLQAPQAGPPAGWYYPALVEHPAIVTNFRGIYNDHLSAHILAFVLAFSRGLHRYLPAQTRAEWNPDAPLVHLPEATALLVGVGGIGGETARLLNALGMTVLAVDPRQESAPPGVAELRTPDQLDALLPRADFIILTAPETPQTQGLFHRNRFSLMKPQAYLINISRGALVKLDDLVEALTAGRIGGAALDVFEEEPLPPEHALWRMPNVMITPHMGGDGPYLPERRTQILIENCRRFADSRPLLNVVDKASWF